jgi:two-component system phosphate regulon response regulator PhoB
MSARIVIADDEPDLLRLVSITLTRHGYEVLPATAGDAALALIKQERPDMAILDISMPGMTGLEVMRAMAGDPDTAHIPVLILSASGQAANVLAGGELGVRSYVLKPFSPIDLIQRVSTILESRGESARRH